MVVSTLLLHLHSHLHSTLQGPPPTTDEWEEGGGGHFSIQQLRKQTKKESPVQVIFPTQF